ncbi:MAG: putative cytosol aminopeptidase [Cyanobacteria bacterium RYN_339]|nr:putative cytosol aminopeptidase [Cyanobacteria bacterium RYN_339]
MNVSVAALPAHQVEAEGLIVGVPEGTTTPAGALAALDAATGGVIAEVLGSATFAGKDGQVEVVYPLRGAKAKRLALVGLGKDALTPETWRQAVAAGMDALRGKVRTVALLLPDGLDAATTPTVEGAVLAGYKFEAYHTKKDDDDRRFTGLTVVGGDEAAAQRAAQLAAAVCWVRDLSNMPGNVLPVPELLTRACAFVEEAGITVKVIDGDDVLKQGFGLLEAVGRGSQYLPAFLIAEYRGAGDDAPWTALVGKGITFDTGGVCIKPRAGMEEMKTDMHGVATVLGALRVIAERKLPLNVVALCPMAENMPDGDAYKPGDIFKAYNGLTVEVLDTDAEGRLILADALAYAVKHYQPKAMVDVATLTGSIIMALGYEATGLFSNNDELSRALLASGTETGERLWRMPTWDVYAENIRSDIADVRHIGKAKGDAITAAMFLKRFVGDTPWAHLDIAGPSWLAEAKTYHAKGSTGVGVRLLVDWLERN